MRCPDGSVQAGRYDPTWVIHNIYVLVPRRVLIKDDTGTVIAHAVGDPSLPFQIAEVLTKQGSQERLDRRPLITRRNYDGNLYWIRLIHNHAWVSQRRFSPWERFFDIAVWYSARYLRAVAACEKLERMCCWAAFPMWTAS